MKASTTEGDRTSTISVPTATCLRARDHHPLPPSSLTDTYRPIHRPPALTTCLHASSSPPNHSSSGPALRSFRPPASPRPADARSASPPPCQPVLSGRSRKGGPARSGGPPFLDRPGRVDDFGRRRVGARVPLGTEHPKGTPRTDHTGRHTLSSHVPSPGSGIRRTEPGGLRCSCPGGKAGKRIAMTSSPRSPSSTTNSVRSRPK